MAVMELWQQRLLPQGGVEAPRVNAGAAIGEAIAQAGNALGGAVQDIARADQIQQQKNDSAWLGNAKPQAELDLNNQIQALNDPTSKTYVDPTSDGYRASVDKLITDYANEATKTAPSDVSKAALSNYISSLRVGYSSAAYQYSDERKLAKRVADIDASNQKWGGLVVANPGRYDDAVKQQEALIRQQIADPDKAEAKVRQMKAGLAGFAMNGQAEKDPRAFLASIDSWVEKGASATGVAEAQGIADTVIKRQEAEAKAEANRRQAAYKANVNALADDAISSAQVNGGVVPLVGGKPMVTEAQIRAANADNPIYAQRLVDKLNAAQKIGQNRKQVESTTQAEDAALVASVTPKPGEVFTEDDAAVQRATIEAVKAKQAAIADEIKQDITDSQNEAVSTINANKADWLQTAAASGVVPDEARTAVAESGSAEAKAFLEKLDQTAELFRAGKQITEQGGAADQDMLGRLGVDIQSTGPGSGQRAADAVALAKAIEDKQKRIADDPAGYFASTTGMQAAWDAVDANPDNVSVASTTISMGIALQEKYGLRPEEIRPFPNARSAKYAATIQSAQPDQALATIDYIRAIAGDRGVQQVLNEKGVPPMAKFLAFADQPAQEPVRAAALEAMKIPQSEIDKRVKDRGIKDSEIDDQIQAVITPLADTLSPSAVGPYSDALTQLTKYYVARGLEPAAAAQQAWSAFDQTYTFHGTYRIPRQLDGVPVDEQKVQDGINSVMQNLDKFGIVPQAGAPANAPEGYALQQTISQLQYGGGRWVTNADDTGVILTYDVDQSGLPGAAVKTKTGRLELLFSDLESGKYGSVFVPVTPAGGLPQGSVGSGYSIDPLGGMKPKGGRGQPNQGVIDYLKGLQ